MNAKGSYRKRFLRFLEELKFDDRLNGMEKWLLFIIAQGKKEEDGSVLVSSRQLGMFLKCVDKTAAKHLRNVAEAGYIELQTNGTDRNGGFRVFFRRAGLLVTFLAMIGTSSPALHKHSPQDNARSTPSNYILSDRRKRRSKRQSIELEHESIDRYTRAAKHPLGQLAISTHTPAQIGAEPESDRSPGRSLS